MASWLSIQSLRDSMSRGYLMVWAFLYCPWAPCLLHSCIILLCRFIKLSLMHCCRSEFAIISCWMMTLWWQLGQAPILSQERGNCGYLSTHSRSLSWRSSHRHQGLPLCQASAGPQNAPLLSHPQNSPLSCPTPTWSLLVPSPSALSLLMKSHMFPLFT